MAHDPSDPEVFEDAPVEETPELGVEAPENDAAEQFADLAPEEDQPLPDADRKERANEADLIEQARVVTIDEDDYR